jgi:glutathione peroxidase-family protein
MTERIDVNGKLAHPIYFYLKVKYIKIVNTK